MSFTYPDKVQIFTTTRDKATKETTLSDPVLSDAFFEESDTVKYGGSGKPVHATSNSERGTVLLLPASAVVLKGDYVQALTIRGETRTDYPKREVRDISPHGVIRPISWEVYLG